MLAALSADPDERSWISPGPIELELGTTPIGAASDAMLEVVLLDEQVAKVRAGIELPQLRFAAWTDRANLFGVIAHDVRVLARDPSDFDQSANPMQVVLHANARVKRLARDHEWTRVRYYGALEVEGWIHDDELRERAAPHTRWGHVPAGQVVSVMPGAMIRFEPKWGTRVLATVADGYFVDSIRDVDDTWAEVQYDDGDVFVHGYWSKHEPPGRLHRPREGEAVAPIVANAKLPAGTCLYGSERGEAIGFVVAEAPAELAATRNGWFAVALDTPWGPIKFAAQGPTDVELATCGPAAKPATSP